MNKFDSLDSFSYQCGVIDAFNEVVKAGVKRIALSHPTDTLAECQALIPFSEQICRQYGNHFYVEQEPLLTDLFPVSINRGKFNILYYRDERDIQIYLSLKEEKKRCSSRVPTRRSQKAHRRRRTAGCSPTRTRPLSGTSGKMMKRRTDL